MDQAQSQSPSQGEAGIVAVDVRLEAVEEGCVKGEAGSPKAALSPTRSPVGAAAWAEAGHASPSAAAKDPVAASFSENELAGDEDKAQQAPNQPRRWCTGRRSRRIFCCASVVGILSGLSVLMWPRDPSWEIQKLDINVGDFIAIMSGGTPPKPLSFSAEVDIWNPNYMGTTTLPGTFEIFYGSEHMGRGSTGPCDVRARSAAHIHVDITMEFTEALAMKVLQDTMSNADLELKVHVNVETPAKLGLLTIKTHVACDVLAAGVRLFSTPEDVIVERHCTYGYSL